MEILSSSTRPERRSTRSDACARPWSPREGAGAYASGNTRPDIALSTGLLCRAMGRPTPELFDAALRVLGYLYRNRHIGLRYVASSRRKYVST